MILQKLLLTIYETVAQHPNSNGERTPNNFWYSCYNYFYRGTNIKVKIITVEISTQFFAHFFFLVQHIFPGL